MPLVFKNCESCLLTYYFFFVFPFNFIVMRAFASCRRSDLINMRKAVIMFWKKYVSVPLHPFIALRLFWFRYYLLLFVPSPVHNTKLTMYGEFYPGLFLTTDCVHLHSSDMRYLSCNKQEAFSINMLVYIPFPFKDQSAQSP